MIQKFKYRLKILSKLLPFTNGVKRFFVLSFILSVLTMILGFVTPFFYQIFIDDVILARDFDRIFVVIICYLAIFLIGIIFSYLKIFSNYKMTNAVLFRAKNKIWNSFLTMPFPEYETTSIGDMKMRLDDDTSQVTSFSGYQTTDYIISYFTMIFVAVFLFFIDWRLAIFSIIAIPLTFFVDHILSKKEKILTDQNRENQQTLSSFLHVSIQGWKEVKALNLRRSQNRKFLRYLHDFALYFAVWINYWTARVLVIPKFKDEFFMQFGLYFIGGLLIINGSLKISDLLVFAMYFGMLSEAVKTVSSTDADLQANMAYTDRLIEELSKSEISKNDKKSVPSDENSIYFDKVSFAYPKTDSEILSNFSLQIDKGERVALVGKNGSGKTTILKLLTGMIEPTKGAVYFGEKNLSEINLSAFHKKIGFIMQENLLFNTTIKENLLYGDENATEKQLIDVCKKAFIYDFIETLPDKFDTIIGEKGIKLSGGQRQRLVLARLFLRDVDIFIFDEATSALDQYSENIVHDAINNIAKDKTIIVVAHRESSINLCDRKIEL